ncbi:uncharacterized protein PSFLO_07717 [Pseudozyma flocculosa]|uniref:Uncharacterized protein n=1 Tax=Pseudozyma flocculosa TaxID=84751 RepID=A0A5C3FCR7_9BASI|nr:uncharacterized protein PSFLO_07717 [Pseudozyma flocculosa]
MPEQKRRKVICTCVRCGGKAVHPQTQRNHQLTCVQPVDAKQPPELPEDQGDGNSFTASQAFTLAISDSDSQGQGQLGSALSKLDPGRILADEVMARTSDPAQLLDPELPNCIKAFLWHVVRQRSHYSASEAGCEAMLRFGRNNLLLALGSTAKIPVRYPTLRKHLGLDRDHIVAYPVCPKSTCSSLSPPLPEQPSLPSASAPPTASGPPTPPPAPTCMRCSKGLPLDRPVFVYLPLEAWLRGLVQQPDVRETLGGWRARGTPSPPFADTTTPLADVYDGELWDQERHFLDSGNDGDINLLLSLLVDWFQPFNFTAESYSCGPIILSVLNLPSSLRFKPEYQHLAGIVPGPSEPSWSTFSSFIEPLVAELLRLQDSVQIELQASSLPTESSVDPVRPTPSTGTTASTAVLRAKLVLFVGDSPARTKVCGFNPLSVKVATCPYCKAGKGDFQQVALGTARPEDRDPDEHQQDSLAARGSSDAAQREAALSTGARYSALYELPYWQSVTMAPVDAMHAVYLGLVKRIWHQLLVKRGLLSNRDITAVQARIKAATVPSTLAKLSIRVWRLAHRSAIRNDMSDAAWIHKDNDDAEHWTWLAHSEQAGNKAAESQVTSHEARFVHRGWLFRDVIVRLAIVVNYLHQRVLTHANIEFVARQLRHLHCCLAHISPIVYNGHILSHMGPQLRRYGLPRAFWAFNTEKANQVLSRSTRPSNKKHGQVGRSLHKAWGNRGRAELIKGPLEERREGVALASRTCERQRTYDDTILALEVALGSKMTSPLPPDRYADLINMLRRTYPAQDFIRTTVKIQSRAVEVRNAVTTHASLSIKGLYFRSSAADILSAPGDSFGFARWPTADDLVPIQLVQIFSHQHRLPATPASADPITTYGAVARIFSKRATPSWHSADAVKPSAAPTQVRLDAFNTAIIPIDALVANAALVPLANRQEAVVKMVM